MYYLFSVVMPSGFQLLLNIVTSDYRLPKIFITLQPYTHFFFFAGAFRVR